MSFANLLTYVTHHSESIIQWLFLTIVALSSVVVGRQIFLKRGEEDAVGAAVAGGPLPSEIQDVLKRILEQTNKLENVSVERMSSSPSGEPLSADVVQQIEMLKKDLHSREEEISRLNKSVQAGGSSSEVEARVKELEAKLEEYSILEDDIADLSLYKEENIRLKNDLEKMRGSGGQVATEPLHITQTPAAPAIAPGSEDLVAEFAQAVSAPNPASAAPAEPAAPATPPAPAKSEEGSDDLFAELAVAEDASAEADGLDTDAMMAEMAALMSAEAKQGDNSALDENVDAEKMIQEAKDLTKSS